MAIRCRAAILRTMGAERPYAHSKPIVIEEVSIEEPQAGEVLVRIAGAGLCHSDLSIINGSRPRPLPLALGHEGAGVVAALGPGIRDVAVGDHIVFQFSASCGRCRYCQEGRPQICERARAATSKGELMGGGRRITDASGIAIAHQAGISCFAEYAVVDRGSVVVVDKATPLDDAAVYGCAVMTGVGAVVNSARIRAGDTVAIIGLGGVGLSGVLGAVLSGAGQIIAIDLDPRKLERAKSFGATQTFIANAPDTIEQIRHLTRGGVDFAIDLAGAIPAMDLAYAITGRGGTVVTAGLSPAGARFSFEQSELVSTEKAIRGSYMGSCVPVRDIPRFIDLQRQGRLPVERLIDRKIGFDAINEGFDLLDSGHAVRQILVPSL